MQAVEQLAQEGRKRKYNSYSDDLRAVVVRMREEGASWARIAALTRVAESAARRIVATARETGNAAKRHKGGNKKPVTSAAVRALIVSVQESDAVLRLRDIAAAVQRELGVSPTLSTVWHILEEEGFTTKKVQQYANARSTPETKQKRADWCRERLSGKAPAVRAETVIFTDETPFSFNIMRTRGRSRAGEPAVGVVPAIRGRNHTVIAAVSPKYGLVHKEIHVSAPEEEFVSKRKGSKTVKTAPRGVTRERFRTFLIHLLDRLRALSPDADDDAESPFTLIFDNAPIHKGDIDETVFQAGHELLFLPPYSPELNAIEYVFSKWKIVYRALFPATEEAVDDAIEEAAKAIEPVDCMHYFRHTQALYERALRLEDL